MVDRQRRSPHNPLEVSGGFILGNFDDMIFIVFLSAASFDEKGHIVPQEQLMTTMLWCFLFGVVHLFVGVGIKGYMESVSYTHLDVYKRQA